MQSIKKNMGRLACALAIAFIAVSASADGAPTSQFGFKGWPYRNSAPCAAATRRPSATPQPTQTPKVTSAPSTTFNVGDYTTLSVSAQEYSAWNLINEDRKANGLDELPLDETLCALARIKACDMKEHKYFAHQSPTFGKAADMLRRFGYSFRSVGENIAHHATVLKSEAAFMSSTGHKANILGSQWSKVGVGVCLDDSGYVHLVQLFVR